MIADVPYDRVRTSMADFRLCSFCEADYLNPRDRRFHAEGICCSFCGPHMFLYDSSKALVDVKDPIFEASRLIDEGFILAIKGIGGFHIAAKVCDDKPILRLREARLRPNQPFAIMSRDLKVMKTYAVVGDEEARLLTSYQRPIVLLRKAEAFYLSELVAPGLHKIGVMLPYTGIHVLLLNYSKEPALIMTSGNLPGLPMVISNEEAFKELGRIVDYMLLHDRLIVNRCDDSVVRFVAGKPTFLRRSRGFAPSLIKLPSIPKDFNVIALGAELQVVGALLKKDSCYLTQFIGDVGNLEALEFLKKALNHLLKINRVDRIDALACDLHPSFLTSRLAEEWASEAKIPLIKVQHHHGHIASLLAENFIPADRKVIGLALDGVGYGSDGSPWGGEVLLASYHSFKRVGSLKPQPMPGGDLCAYYPARMLAGVLSSGMSIYELRRILTGRCLKGFRSLREVEVVIRQIETGFNTPKTTSMGRVLDALAALLGVCYERTYEGEPAMKLEALASKGDPEALNIQVPVEKSNGIYRLDTTSLFLKVLEELGRCRIEDIASSAQASLASSLADVALKLASEHNVDYIGISGGVSYNDMIVSRIKQKVIEKGLTFLQQTQAPPGDGGIALGQCVIASFQTLK